MPGHPTVEVAAAAAPKQRLMPLSVRAVPSQNPSWPAWHGTAALVHVRQKKCSTEQIAGDIEDGTTEVIAWMDEQIGHPEHLFNRYR
ncbi:MAG: hypothetical protein H7234_04310 [Herminiimonas sp.]|nr:hypothetical protein [Herminiimonas sp.]